MIIARLDSVAVAYSGGTDSAYLLAVCLDVLGPDQVVALTADSPLTPRSELADARALAKQLGARHLVLASNDLDNETIVANPPDRCYYCKFRRFGALLEITRTEGMAFLLHGENADDVEILGRLSAPEQLAHRLAEKAQRIKKPITMGQMSAHDRRIVHLALKDNPSVNTKSRGEGYLRKLVIFPKRKNARMKKNNSYKNG